MLDNQAMPAKPSWFNVLFKPAGSLNLSSFLCASLITLLLSYILSYVHQLFGIVLTSIAFDVLAIALSAFISLTLFNVTLKRLRYVDIYYVWSKWILALLTARYFIILIGAPTMHGGFIATYLGDAFLIYTIVVCFISSKKTPAQQLSMPRLLTGTGIALIFFFHVVLFVPTGNKDFELFQTDFVVQRAASLSLSKEAIDIPSLEREANRYANGIRQEKDIKKALQLYRTSHDLGSMDAALYIADIYAAAGNKEKTIEWLKKAELKGSDRALYQLGKLNPKKQTPRKIPHIKDVCNYKNKTTYNEKECRLLAIEGIPEQCAYASTLEKSLPKNKSQSLNNIYFWYGFCTESADGLQWRRMADYSFTGSFTTQNYAAAAHATAMAVKNGNIFYGLNLWLLKLFI